MKSINCWKATEFWKPFSNIVQYCCFLFPITNKFLFGHSLGKSKLTQKYLSLRNISKTKMVYSSSDRKFIGSGNRTTNPKGNLRSTPFLRKLRMAFFGFHILSLVIGCVAIFLGIWVTHIENEKLNDLKLKDAISKSYSVLSYVGGGCIIAAGILGGLALIKENIPYFWIFYTMLMAVVCLVLFTLSISTLTQTISKVDEKLHELMKNYTDILPWEVVDREAIDIVDNFQEHNECCGIESYKDWQDVGFGKTSLRVPQSCCNVKSSKGIRLNRANAEILTQDNSELAEEFKYCGHLCLPDSDNLEVIFTRGCKDPLIHDLKITILAIGGFGLITSVLAGGLFFLSCYLVVWKKV